LFAKCDSKSEKKAFTFKPYQDNDAKQLIESTVGDGILLRSYFLMDPLLRFKILFYPNMTTNNQQLNNEIPKGD
jgi:hypothetical protein